MKTTFFKLALLAGLLTLMAACADESNTVETPPDINVMGMSTMTSLELTSEMGTGWNLGNTLEHEEDHGGDNPEPTQQLFDAIKAAGFKTVRIPVAWSKFIDETNFTIDPAWLDHVEKVVNYARNNDMYVILNEHFDGDWIRPTYTQQAYVNSRLDIMWKQIATRFKDYDYHLLFAGTNEVKIEGYDGTVTAEHIEVQQLQPNFC